jgi:hypothetical protein
MLKRLLMSCLSMTDNVLHIPEEGEIEAQNLKFKQMYNRSTELEHSNKTPFLGICCYRFVLCQLANYGR